MPRREKTIKKSRTKHTWDPAAVEDQMRPRELVDAASIREIVALPEGENVNEWLAVHTTDFFNQISLLYSTMSDYCTDASCPKMTAGPKFEYFWADEFEHKHPTQVSAPRYIHLLMRWVSRQLRNQAIFPARPGEPFPDNFREVVARIFRRMFRVYAHIYHCHWADVQAHGQQRHLETCTKHFVFFVKEFSLIADRDLEPLATLVRRWAE